METNKIICGDCLEVLKTLPDECVDCVVTSPPYWALRDYGVAGQLGLEPTFQEYVNKLCDIFDEVKRVLKKEGTCWVNIGDSYAGSGKAGNNLDYQKEHTSFGKVMEKGSYGVPTTNQTLTDKSLCNIPARFSIEMQNRGWILRNEIVWHKPNCMPSSVKDRFTVDFEKVYFFVKSKKYFFETQFEETKAKVIEPRMKTGRRDIYSEKYENGFATRSMERNKRCVWTITTKPFKEAHFATYPEALIEPIIKAGCPEFVCNKCGKSKEKIYEKGNLVSSGPNKMVIKKQIGININHNPDPYGDMPKRILKEIGLTDCGCNAGFSGGIVRDPFMGAGTTALVALKQNKQFVGIELNPEYIKIAQERIKPYLEQTRLG